MEKGQREVDKTFPDKVVCAKEILDHGMSQRTEINGKILPFIADPKIVLAEAHTFRKSLCEGKKIKGYEWLGPSRLYNNGTCHLPEKHWMRCGHGKEEHECNFFERQGIAIRGVLSTAIDETAEIIYKGFASVKG